MRAIAAFAPLVAWLATPACHRGQAGQKPVASLATTTGASRAFEHLRTMWSRNDPSERPQLRKEIDAFVRAFPADGLTPVAQLYGVLTLMEPPADWPQAERRLESMAVPPPGSTHDLYVVALAKVRRYHHQPEAAFELLRPIAGTIVGSRARALLQEELTFDALESREPYEAIAYMDAWLRGSSEDERAASEAKVAVALGAVPEAALRGSLTAMRTGRRAANGAPSDGYGELIQRLVAERLGQIAVERGDAALARWLLDPTEGEPMLGEEISGSLGQLATSRRGIGTVAGRTLGLVLPTSSPELRDEVADVLRGVLWALRSQGMRAASGDGPGTGVRLVTRDDGGEAGGLRAAMEEVAGEGASVIVTALDPETASEAVDWASSSSLNVIVLAMPARGSADNVGGGARNVFSVGEDWGGELGALAAAFAGAAPSGSTTAPRLAPGSVVTLADTEELPVIAAAARVPGAPWASPLSCDVAPTVAGVSRFPVGAWASSGVRRWLVAGSTACASDLLAGIRAPASGAVVALSLEAAEVSPPARAGLAHGGPRVVVASAGVVPIALAAASDARAADVHRMVATTGAPGGWWVAVGHDAAVLASAALGRVSLDTTSDPAEIARRRARVREGLLEAHAPLWTSDAVGFDGAYKLERTVRAVELGK